MASLSPCHFSFYQRNLGPFHFLYQVTWSFYQLTWNVISHIQLTLNLTFALDLAHQTVNDFWTLSDSCSLQILTDSCACLQTLNDSYVSQLNLNDSCAYHQILNDSCVYHESVTLSFASAYQEIVIETYAFH